jgi:hypothetical protein
MKKLPAVFRSDGFDFELLKRDGDIALFRKTKPGFSFETFEVVVVQHHKERMIAGKSIEDGEAMPSSEQWGSKGWLQRSLFYRGLRASRCLLARPDCCRLERNLPGGFAFQLSHWSPAPFSRRTSRVR